MADIDSAFGEEPSPIELFETNGKLSESEKCLLDTLYALDVALLQLIEKAMVWAWEQGYQTGQADEAQRQTLPNERRI